MKTPAFLNPKNDAELIGLALGVLVIGYAIVKWGIPALAKAGAGAATGTLNAASTLPAAAITATGNAVGSSLDAVGTTLLGDTYNKIPATWSQLWADITGSDANTTSKTTANPPTMDFGLAPGSSW